MVDDRILDQGMSPTTDTGGFQMCDLSLSHSQRGRDASHSDFVTALSWQLVSSPSVDRCNVRDMVVELASSSKMEVSLEFVVKIVSTCPKGGKTQRGEAGKLTNGNRHEMYSLVCSTNQNSTMGCFSRCGSPVQLHSWNHKPSPQFLTIVQAIHFHCQRHRERESDVCDRNPA